LTALNWVLICETKPRSVKPAAGVSSVGEDQAGKFRAVAKDKKMSQRIFLQHNGYFWLN
jgi:hypothetical protein